MGDISSWLAARRSRGRRHNALRSASRLTSTSLGSQMTTATDTLCEAIWRKCRESIATKEQFFRDHAERIAECAAAMAKRFDEGGRLLVMGNGGSSCDAAHVSVE